jgi:uncharacterized protein YggT (Ycf19 family)
MRSTAIRFGRALLWLVYAWVTVTMVLLFLAFLLQLFGANPTAGFVEWVYRSVERGMAPFRGIFEPIVFSDQSVLDLSILFAMVVYGFIALGLHMGLEATSRALRRAERDEGQQRLVAETAAAAEASRVIHLAGATSATATARISPQPWGTSIELGAAGLDPMREYEAWFASPGGGRVSAGRFRPDGAGAAQVTLRSGAAPATSTTLGISVVPGPGEAPQDLLAGGVG